MCERCVTIPSRLQATLGEPRHKALETLQSEHFRWFCAWQTWGGAIVSATEAVSVSNTRHLPPGESPDSRKLCHFSPCSVERILTGCITGPGHRQTGAERSSVEIQQSRKKVSWTMTDPHHRRNPPFQLITSALVVFKMELETRKLHRACDSKIFHMRLGSSR